MMSPSALHEALAAHPAVAHVELVVHGGRTIALIEPPPGYTEETTGNDERAVRGWQDLYNWIYSGIGDGAPIGTDFSGWISTYTGRAIETDQMREWRDAVVGELLALAPRRVLEIGVGLGLLLAPIAPTCEEYWGTDFSPEAVAALQAKLVERPDLVGRVVLSAQRADDTTGLPADHFDVVVINSVTQYFPSAGYLAAVVERAMGLLRPGGTLYVGDVRDARTLRAFRTAVRTETTGPGRLRELIDRDMALEKELVVHPDFFAALADRLPEIAAVDMRVKRGLGANELNHHRYDVRIRRAPGPALPPLPRRSWTGSLAELGDHLVRTHPARLRVIGVPNQRVHAEIAALNAFNNESSTAEVAVHPEELHRFGERLGYHVVVAVSASQSGGTVDAVFTETPETVPYESAGRDDLPLPAYVVSPFHPATATYVSDLRDHLERAVPEVEPPEFVVLPSAPGRIRPVNSRVEMP